MWDKEFKYHILTYRDTLYRTALRIVKNHETAEDLVQEAMFRMWNIRDRWGAIENHKAFMVKIVRNLSLDYLASRNVQVLPLDLLYGVPDSESAIDEQIIKNERMSFLHRNIESLPEKLRTILLLRIVEEMSYKEIGIAMNMNQSLVKIGLFRAKQKLQDLMNKHKA